MILQISSLKKWVILLFYLILTYLLSFKFFRKEVQSGKPLYVHNVLEHLDNTVIDQSKLALALPFFMKV